MRPIRKLVFSIALAFYFLYELVKSSVNVAAAVLAPSRPVRPTFLMMPLDATSDLEIMLTANLISLTPGTLSVDVEHGRGHLLIHSMFGADDPEDETRALKEGMERRVLRATRGERF